MTTTLKMFNITNVDLMYREKSILVTEFRKKKSYKYVEIVIRFKYARKSLPEK